MNLITYFQLDNLMFHKYGLLDDMEAKESCILERLKKEAKAGLLSSNQTIQVTYKLLEPINEPDKSYTIYSRN